MLMVDATNMKNLLIPNPIRCLDVSVLSALLGGLILATRVV